MSRAAIPGSPIRDRRRAVSIRSSHLVSTAALDNSPGRFYSQRGACVGPSSRFAIHADLLVAASTTDGQGSGRLSSSLLIQYPQALSSPCFPSLHAFLVRLSCLLGVDLRSDSPVVRTIRADARLRNQNTHAISGKLGFVRHVFASVDGFVRRTRLVDHRLARATYNVQRTTDNGQRTNGGFVSQNPSRVAEGQFDPPPPPSSNRACRFPATRLAQILVQVRAIAFFRSGTGVQADLLTSDENMTSAGALGSTRVTPLHSYYVPLRLPAGPTGGCWFPVSR